MASILQAATVNLAGIIVLRCLIGAFEAGFAPGVALFLSFFYHRSEMGFRYGLFISFSPIANCFASALAYGIVHAKTSLAQWQLLFIIGKSGNSTHRIVLTWSSGFKLRGNSYHYHCASGVLLPSEGTRRMSIPYPERE